MDGHAKGTEMCVRDLVSNLPGWNALVVKWITSDAKGLSVDSRKPVLCRLFIGVSYLIRGNDGMA